MTEFFTFAVGSKTFGAKLDKTGSDKPNQEGR